MFLPVFERIGNISKRYLIDFKDRPVRMVGDRLEADGSCAIWQAMSCAKYNLDGLVHQADRGSQYASNKYSERLAVAGINSSAETVGEFLRNALTETVDGLYKAESIYPRTRRLGKEIEWVSLNWVHWWDNIRLHESLGYATHEEVIASFNEHRFKQVTPV